MHCEYTHIIWDWNGTLFDDAWLCIDVMNQLLQERNLEPMTAEKYATIFGFPVREYYSALQFDFNTEPFEKISTAFIERYEAGRSTCSLRANAVEILKLTLHAGIGQSILSAAKYEFLHDAVTHFNLAEYFKGIYGVDDHHAHGKTEIGRKLMRQLELRPSDTLMVGDTLHDVDVARMMDVDCVLVASGHQSISRLHTAGVPVLEKLADLLGIFKCAE